MRIVTLIVLWCCLALPAFGEPLQTIPEAKLRGVVQDFLLKKSQGINAEVKVKKAVVPAELKLPAGTVTYEVIAPERWEGWGNTSLAVVIRVDDQVKRNLTVPVEVEALTDMVIANRTLERGEVVQSSDVSVAKRDLAKVGGRFCRDVSEVVGLQVKSAIGGNSPMRRDYLERVPLIKSGQMVTIVAENAVVRITASGRAKTSGAAGDLIAVLNLSSQKEIAARVVDSSTVQVDF
ncbi:flagellar basal body P-ring formation chaperone FlgA [Geomesophilobacter sediminis]|uniref:Flagella basal body P-ring formation protein FlgA n=1 Tax=Geomesophilobacter sediminis TaxID=2798584 RepID=A0A8J7JLF1_9BACT|nr:flagellar basal body P-ring formation chaperone FlgA [Geomesophilobacter sediminis]MBJ6724820.1 flagellar basal body P-ring formation protein FlgA [Geomesophilobacter sediminis]